MNRPACENLKPQPIPTLFEVTNRVAAVDEDQGIVREYCKIYGGQIHAVEAFMLAMPRGTPSGWDVK
jgi:hypothetical protein